MLFRSWAVAPATLVTRLGTSTSGLTAGQADARLQDVGPNVLHTEDEVTRWRVMVRQWKSPLLLLLVFAAAASALSGEWVDAGIVITIVVATVAIGYSREYSAHTAAAALRARLGTRVTTLRDGHTVPEIGRAHV